MANVARAIALCHLHDIDFVVAGRGSRLFVYDGENEVVNVAAFEDELGSVLGVSVFDFGASADCMAVLVWGRRRASLWILHYNAIMTMYCDFGAFDDWVIRGKILELELEWDAETATHTLHGLVILGLAHNVVEIYQVDSSNPALFKLVQRNECVEGPVILSMDFMRIDGSGGDAEIMVASGTVFGSILLWKTNKNKDSDASTKNEVISDVKGHNGGVFGIEWNRNPSRGNCSHFCYDLASVSDDRTIQVWNIDIDAHDSYDHDHTELECTLITTMFEHTSRVWNVLFVELEDIDDDAEEEEKERGKFNFLLTGCEDGFIRIFKYSHDSSNSKSESECGLVCSEHAHSGSVWSIGTTPWREKRKVAIVSGGSDCLVTMWSLSPHSQVNDHILQSHPLIGSAAVPIGSSSIRSHAHVSITAVVVIPSMSMKASSGYSIVCGTQDGALYIISQITNDYYSWEWRLLNHEHSAAIHTLAVSKSKVGNMNIVVGYRDGTMMAAIAIGCAGTDCDCDTFHFLSWESGMQSRLAKVFYDDSSSSSIQIHCTSRVGEAASFRIVCERENGCEYQCNNYARYDANVYKNQGTAASKSSSRNRGARGLDITSLAADTESGILVLGTYNGRLIGFKCPNADGDHNGEGEPRQWLGRIHGHNSSHIHSITLLKHRDYLSSDSGYFLSCGGDSALRTWKVTYVIGKENGNENGNESILFECIDYVPVQLGSAIAPLKWDIGGDAARVIVGVQHHDLVVHDLTDRCDIAKASGIRSALRTTHSVLMVGSGKANSVIVIAYVIGGKLHVQDGQYHGVSEDASRNLNLCRLGSLGPSFHSRSVICMLLVPSVSPSTSSPVVITGGEDATMRLFSTTTTTNTTMNMPSTLSPIGTLHGYSSSTVSALCLVDDILFSGGGKGGLNGWVWPWSGGSVDRASTSTVPWAVYHWKADGTSSHRRDDGHTYTSHVSMDTEAEVDPVRVTAITGFAISTPQANSPMDTHHYIVVAAYANETLLAYHLSNVSIVTGWSSRLIATLATDRTVMELVTCDFRIWGCTVGGDVCSWNLSSLDLDIQTIVSVPCVKWKRHQSAATALALSSLSSSSSDLLCIGSGGDDGSISLLLFNKCKCNAQHHSHGNGGSSSSGDGLIRELKCPEAHYGGVKGLCMTESRCRDRDAQSVKILSLGSDRRLICWNLDVSSSDLNLEKEWVNIVDVADPLAMDMMKLNLEEKNDNDDGDGVKSNKYIVGISGSGLQMLHVNL